jgi:mannosyltransferase
MRNSMEAVPRPSTGPHLWLCLAIAGLGVAARAEHLASRSLWLDESVSWRVIRFPWTEMVERLSRDVHSPFYFSLLKLWTLTLGDSLLAMRGFGVLFSVVTSIGTYLLVLEVFGHRPKGATTFAALTSALVTLSPGQIFWSSQIRMYSLATALAVFSSWALLRALRPGAGSLRWLLYGVLALLLVYAHYFSSFLVLSQGFFALIVLLKRYQWTASALLRSMELRRAFWALLVFVVGWLPWLPVFLRQQSHVSANIAPVAAPNTAWRALELWYGLVIPGRVPHRAILVAGAVAIVAALIFFLWKEGVMALLPLLGAVVPWGLGVLLSMGDVALVHQRFLLPVQMFAIMGVVGALLSLPGRVTWAVPVVGLLAVTFDAGLKQRELFFSSLKPDARAAAEYLTRIQRPDDTVVVAGVLFHTMSYHSKDARGWRLYAHQGRVPFYGGGAFVSDADQVTRAEDLPRLGARGVVVVETNGYEKGDRSVTNVPALSCWKRAEADSFAMAIPPRSDILVTRYEVPPDCPAEPPPPSASGG